MNYLLAQLTEGAYVIAVEDTHTWDVMSYTNCYVLKRNGQIILIDAGLLEYQKVMGEALTKIGITFDQVTHVLLTHGHRDHIEGTGLFRKARKYIHHADMAVPAAEFTPYVPQSKEFTFAAEGVSDLSVVLVNTHSPGSVAIFDKITKALFVGDFFCYFGEDLSDGELVTASNVIKQGSCDYVAGQAAAQEPGFDRFMLGLGRLLCYQPEFFCTGHGVVLRQDIQTFLKRMWQSGTHKHREKYFI